jgi:hypothetical protein
MAATVAVSFACAPLVPLAGAQQYPDQTYREPLPEEPGSDWSDQIPAHVSVVDGTVELERDGQRQAAEENEPLLAGDRLRTDRGRAEVLFSDGSALSLDNDTDVDLLSDSLLRVQAGRIRLAIARGSGELAYRVDAAGTTTWLRSAGEYRILVDTRSAEPEVYVTVLRGAAELESGSGRTLIRTGLEARANARMQPSLPYAANVASWDGFDRWVDDQQRYRTGARSTQYLPSELRHYGGAFDHDGGWEYEQGYGYVWFPRVAVGWRPYYHGGWSYVGAFGWTWVGGGRWTWPTHHYGRWGLRGARWFWIPGRRWAPAWVSWASAPGYYGWCPLGFDNRPVISITNIHVYGGDRRYGWTVLPSHRFGPRVAVSRWAVSPGDLDISRGRFTQHASSPVRPSFATRQVEPLRAPTYASGRYAIARSPRSAGGSISTNPTDGGANARSSIARDRSVPSAGRPSNPVTRPSAADEGSNDRGSGARTAGPRSRTSPSQAPPQETRPEGGRVSPRSTAPSAAPERSGGNTGQSSGQAGPRRRQSSAPPMPMPGERNSMSRRSSSAPSVGASIERPAPTREMGRMPAPRVSSPGSERVGRADRSISSRPSPVDRSMPSRPARAERSMPSAPMRSAPRLERSAPSSSPRAQPSPRSSSASGSPGGGGGENRGQARSRNSR